MCHGRSSATEPKNFPAALEEARKHEARSFLMSGLNPATKTKVTFSNTNSEVFEVTTGENFDYSDFESDTFCRYCKRAGHVINDCFQLQRKRDRERCSSNAQSSRRTPPQCDTDFDDYEHDNFEHSACSVNATDRPWRHYDMTPSQRQKEKASGGYFVSSVSTSFPCFHDDFDFEKLPDSCKARIKCVCGQNLKLDLGCYMNCVSSTCKFAISCAVCRHKKNCDNCH